MGLSEKYIEILNQMTRDLFETKEVKGFLETKLTRKKAQSCRDKLETGGHRGRSSTDIQGNEKTLVLPHQKSL